MNKIVKFEESKEYNEHQATLAMLKEMATIALKSGKYPKEYDECTILNIYLTAKALGVHPMKALNGGMYIVNGKISMSTSLLADMIRRAGHSIKILEMTKEKCVILGIRKDNEDSAKIEFNMEDAHMAGLTGSQVWKKYPKAMLYNRAMSMLARVLWPDVTGNPYSEDEADDIKGVAPKDKKDVDPDAAITINVPHEVHISKEQLNEQTGEVQKIPLNSPQEAILDSYLIDDMPAIELIKKNLEIADVYLMDQRDFDRTIEWLEKRKEVRNARLAAAQ